MKMNVERLIECRERLGITKLEASKRLNLSQPAYVRYEGGYRNPSIHVLYKMAEVFQTSTDYLLDKTDNPTPNAYIVYDDEKSLFCFIEKYKRSDEVEKERLNAYIQKLLHEK